jgi:hypothetical protein
MVRVISFSLWGNSDKYCIGALKNIQLARTIYPGWEVWLYLPGLPIHPIVSYLQGAQVHGVDVSHVVMKLEPEGFEGWKGMFARFQPAFDPHVEVMISRDCDSRLSLREKAAVDEWIESDKGFHTIHDHAHHTVPILGGLWGIKSGILPEFGVLLERWPKENRWQTDQEFLTQEIWPRVKHNTMNHAEFHTHIWPGCPIPLPRSGREFIGATYDEKDVIDSEQQRLLYGG